MIYIIFFSTTSCLWVFVTICILPCLVIKFLQISPHSLIFLYLSSWTTTVFSQMCDLVCALVFVFFPTNSVFKLLPNLSQIKSVTKTTCHSDSILLFFFSVFVLFTYSNVFIIGGKMFDFPNLTFCCFQCI